MPVPTPSPVSESLSRGLITILVETDPIKPEDLGWELTSVPDGEVIEFAPIGYYAGNYQVTFQHDVIVDPENFYKLTIYDDKSDGEKYCKNTTRDKIYISISTLSLVCPQVFSATWQSSKVS